MMMMKMTRGFLILGFVLVLALDSEAQPLAFAPQAESCCFNFFTNKIPPQNILEVKRTGTHCAQHGFIVTTPKFPSLCVREITIPGTATP